MGLAHENLGLIETKLRLQRMINKLLNKMINNKIISENDYQKYYFNEGQIKADLESLKQ